MIDPIIQTIVVGLACYFIGVGIGRMLWKEKKVENELSRTQTDD